MCTCALEGNGKWRRACQKTKICARVCVRVCVCGAGEACEFGCVSGAGRLCVFACVCVCVVRGKLVNLGA